jgi:hypothetical protein
MRIKQHTPFFNTTTLIDALQLLSHASRSEQTVIAKALK